jgi:hypothetical protein
MKKILAVLLCVAMFMSLAVTAAADFTPSVTAKRAPEATKAVDSTGKTVEVKVSAVAEAEETNEETKEVLTTAYDTILAADSISEIVSDKAELEEVLKEVAPDVAVEDLVVRDLLHIDVGEISGDVTVTLDAGLDPDVPVIVLYSVDGVTWEVLPSDSYVVNSDGSIEVTISGSCAIAFAVPSSD